MIRPSAALPFAEHRDADRRVGHLIVAGAMRPGAIRQPAIAKVAGAGTPQDIAYLVHAGNGYPKLVWALKEAIATTPPDSAFLKSRVALLRELGEV